MAAAQVVGFPSEQVSGGDASDIHDVEDVLDDFDATDLRWYFRVGGMAMFSSSTMGPMLERASLFGAHARGCRACGGDAKRNIGGTGWTVGKRPRASMPTAEQVAIARWAKGIYRQQLFADEPCRKCSGTGWRPAGRRVVPRALQTARPMGSSIKKAGGPSATVKHMEVLAIVGRRLDQVGPENAATFLAYFDEEGGSILGVWALTPAGKTLLRRNSTDLDPVRFFENQRLDQEAHRDAGRQALFEAADEQAAERLRNASRKWNSIKQAEEKKRCLGAT
jgi:hypothetical protein